MLVATASSHDYLKTNLRVLSGIVLQKSGFLFNKTKNITVGAMSW